MNIPFKEGDTISLLWGEYYRVVTIIKIDHDNDKSFVSGMSSDYWIKNKTILSKLDGDIISRAICF